MKWFDAIRCDEIINKVIFSEFLKFDAIQGHEIFKIIHFNFQIDSN